MFIILSISGSAMVFADDISDPYIKHKKDVQSIVYIFNSRVKGNIGDGEFEVNAIQSNEKSTRYNIKYKLENGKVFQHEYDYRSDPAARIKITLELSANKFGGISGLVFNYLIYNPDIEGSKDTYIVIPQDKRFTSLDFDKKMLLEVRDLDQDNDSEILDFEQQPWSVEECGWGDSNITGLFLPKVFHLDPKSGKLLDVSRRFPQVYKEEVEKWYFSSESQQLIKNSTQISPECKAKYFGFLDRVQKASEETKTSTAESSIPEITAREFEIKFRNQHIDKLVNLLGESTRIENISSELRYTWNYDDINKMPVRIIIMFKHEGDYYCDEFIANINSSKIITSLWCKSNRLWLTKAELEKKQSIGQKSGNDIQQLDNYVDLGSPGDEQRHNLRGWDAINPGLLPAGLDSDVTSRYQRLRSSNSVDVFVPQVGRSYTLSFRTEDGLCDDSFEVYINGSGPLYRYRHRTSSQVYPLHQVVIPSTLVTSTTVTVTFVNVASDSCGRAATYFVRLD